MDKNGAFILQCNRETETGERASESEKKKNIDYVGTYGFFSPFTPIDIQAKMSVRVRLPRARYSPISEHYLDAFVLFSAMASASASTSPSPSHTIASHITCSISRKICVFVCAKFCSVDFFRSFWVDATKRPWRANE